MSATRRAFDWTRPRIAGRAAHVAVAVMMSGLAACADAPTGPRGDVAAPLAAKAPAPAVVREEGAAVVRVLGRRKTVGREITVSKVIDAQGGEIKIKSAGFKLRVPSGALAGPTTISVTALAGGLVAYEINAAGATLLKPVRIDQRLQRTAWRHKGKQGPALFLAGFGHRGNIDSGTGTALANWTQSHSKLKPKRVRFEVMRLGNVVVSTDRGTLVALDPEDEVDDDEDEDWDEGSDDEGEIFIF